MLPATTTRPHLSPPLLLIALGAFLSLAAWTIHETELTSAPYTHRYRFSAFGAIHDAFCTAQSPLVIPNALQHDTWGNPYVWECNPRGFTIVSAGEDGVYGTADDTRSNP